MRNLEKWDTWCVLQNRNRDTENKCMNTKEEGEMDGMNWENWVWFKHIIDTMYKTDS